MALLASGKHTKEVWLPPESESLEFKLYNCKPGTELTFRLHPLLTARHVHFSTNYPVQDPTAVFARDKLSDVPWRTSQKILKEFDPDRSISFQVDRSGAYNFMYAWDTEEGVSVRRKGYFIVEPKTAVPVNSITMQTYLVRCLGKLEDWKPRLWLSKYCNYNAIHFTPVQERGRSDSAYSIRDHLKLHPGIVAPDLLGKLGDQQPIKLENRLCSEFQYEIDLGHLVLEEQLRNSCSEWGVLRVVDLVWNHSSWDAPWLRAHPEAGYNLLNSPHLIPAYILDRELHHISKEIGEGLHLERYGVGTDVTQGDTQGYRDRLGRLLHELLSERTRLHEYYTMDVEQVYSRVYQRLQATDLGAISPPEPGAELRVLNEAFIRGEGRVEEKLALRLFFSGLSSSSSAGKIENCLGSLRRALTELNLRAQSEVDQHLSAAVSSLLGGFDWRFLNPRGPNLRQITALSPISPEYFFHLDADADRAAWLSEEQLRQGEHAVRVLLHNGYVMNWDALRNMSAPDSHVYLRREVVIWGDSCRLNYGSCPQDSPWLWEYMRHYTIMMARMFDGFRIDNCHNTPLHLAEYMLDQARLINPNLLVIAELFTNSLETDSIFINRMGLNLLIRESLVADTPHNLGALIYTFGGKSIGSFFHQTCSPSLGDTPLAIFYDVTHDNQSIVDAHSAFDAVPTTALIAMTAGPTGSCRGYDELVPHMVHVVREKRLYRSYKEEELSHGLFKVKRELNRLHSKMISEGFTEIYVHDVTEVVVSITRHNPDTLDSIVLVAHTCFSQPSRAHTPTQQEKHTPYCPPSLSLEGTVTEVVLEAFLRLDTSFEFAEDKEAINGLTGYVPFMQNNVNPNRSKLVKIASKEGGANISVDFIDFPPGAVVVLFLKSKPESLNAANALRGLAAFHPIHRVAKVSYIEGMNARNTFDSEVSKLGLLDFNFILYHVESEEGGVGGGLYDIPHYGKTVYAGFQGLVTILDKIRQSNNLGHPLCENVRSGDWLAEFVGRRLQRRKSLLPLSRLLLTSFSHLSKVPKGLKPSYFDLTISSLHQVLLLHCMTHFSPLVRDGSSLLRNLALGSVQLVSDCKSAALPIDNRANASQPPLGSLAAGLPHFASGSMRCWGRDTFIALHGILIVPGRVEEAKQHLLSFASTVRHGMIPNLLASGEHSRYNCRDAPWWWMHSVKQYAGYTGESGILQQKVTRVFSSDDAAPFTDAREEPVHDIIQEILQRHWDGIRFRERNAGVALDRDMSEEGFLIEACVDPVTGFVKGGSERNCGTWMDKMGSSERAGNKGKPATPRDGSAVELVGLCQAVVKWLCELNGEGVYPYEGVDAQAAEGDSGKAGRVTFKEWSERIVNNFEAKFWIPPDREEAGRREGDLVGYVNKTGIYKDCYGASQRWTDYQLRPNFPIAMVVAPELFTPANARIAIKTAEDNLLGPLGMRTLDRDDWSYRGNYIMSDSEEFNTAHGFNYHQGPEWLWLTGYFLQAKLLLGGSDTMAGVRSVYQVLGRVSHCLLSSDWKSLPELTNEDGSECGGSCPAQAWSVATIIDTLYSLHNNFSAKS